MSLLLAELGASGPTGVAIRRALYLRAEISPDDLRRAASAHARGLSSHDAIQLSLVNALWADQRLPQNPNFIADARELYEAEARTLDFADELAADTINAWVRQATANLLSGIVTSGMLAQPGACTSGNGDGVGVPIPRS